MRGFRDMLYESGFSLVELVLVIVIGGILATVALRSLVSINESARVEETKHEMDIIARAIAGNPTLHNAHTRSDFGYLGDVGAFPPDLDALHTNPGGYSTWKGPYIRNDFEQVTGDYKSDAWGSLYVYNGALSLSSTGSGTTIRKQLPGESADYLNNRVTGVILDLDGTAPGENEKDSVEIILTHPDGVGGLAQITSSPGADGYFSAAGIPVGNHELRLVYLPMSDTLKRFVSVSPGSDTYSEYRFGYDVWPATPAGPCGGAGTITLRPVGPGSSATLDNQNCSANWQCVDEATPDDHATYVERADDSYGTDTYSVEDPPASNCTITDVTVYCRAYKEFMQGYVKLVVHVDGADYEGNEQSLTGTYTNYSERWTANPATGTAWTWNEITTLEAGLALRGQNVNFSAYCTQVWVEVNYDY